MNMNNTTELLDLNETMATTEPEVDFIFEFLVPSVLLNGVGILGLVGNLLSIFILSRPQMKGSTNCILIGLATYDSILILSSILMFGLPSVFNYTKSYFSFYYWEVFPYITPFVYPIGLIAQTSSAYLTLCVTVERYVAVCLPLKARSLCTYGRARGCVLGLGAAAVIYNIPRFFEVEWVSAYNADVGENRTIVAATKIRLDPTYISVYITWLYLVVMYIVPFTSLAVLNLRIYVQVRRANAERAKLSRLQQREIGMATMLLCVVIVFFVCNILALVVNVLELMTIAITGLTQISNLMVTLNSSVNFIIYCIYGEKFKRLFCAIFCSKCGGARRDNLVMLRRYTTTRGCISSDSHNGSLQQVNGRARGRPMECSPRNRQTYLEVSSVYETNTTFTPPTMAGSRIVCTSSSSNNSTNNINDNSIINSGSATIMAMVVESSFETSESPAEKKVSMKFLSVCPAPKHIRLQSPAAKRTNSCRSYNGPISPTVSAERDWAKLGRSSSSSSSAKQCSKIQQSLRRDEEDDDYSICLSDDVRRAGDADVVQVEKEIAVCLHRNNLLGHHSHHSHHRRHKSGGSSGHHRRRPPHHQQRCRMPDSEVTTEDATCQTDQEENLFNLGAIEKLL